MALALGFDFHCPSRVAPTSQHAVANTERYAFRDPWNENNPPDMFKTGTLLEKSLLAVTFLSIFSIPFFKEGGIRYIPSYSIFLCIFLVSLSQAIRLWKLINPTERTVSIMSILMVVSGSSIFVFQNWEIGIIMFLIGAMAHSITVEKALKESIKSEN